jgi:hypothetical protein
MTWSNEPAEPESKEAKRALRFSETVESKAAKLRKKQFGLEDYL